VNKNFYIIGVLNTKQSFLENFQNSS